MKASSFALAACLVVTTACKKDPPPPPPEPPLAPTKPAPINVLASAEPSADPASSSRFTAQLGKPDAGDPAGNPRGALDGGQFSDHAKSGVVAVGGSVATVPIDNMDRVLAGSRPRFRRCYWEALEIDPKVVGSLVLVITVAPSGEVTNVEASEVKGIPESLQKCLASRTRNLIFNAPEKSESSKIKAPLTFSIGDRQGPSHPEGGGSK